MAEVKHFECDGEFRLQKLVDWYDMSFGDEAAPESISMSKERRSQYERWLLRDISMRPASWSVVSGDNGLTFRNVKVIAI